MEQHPQGHLGADALENSEQLLKAALDDNRRRRAIKIWPCLLCGRKRICMRKNSLHWDAPAPFF